MDLMWLAVVGVALLLAGGGTLIYDRVRRHREIESLLNREISTNMLDDTAIQPRISSSKAREIKGKLFSLPTKLSKVGQGVQGSRFERVWNWVRSKVGQVSKSGKAGKGNSKVPGGLIRVAAIALLVFACLGVSAAAIVVTRAGPKLPDGSVVMGVCSFVGEPTPDSLSNHLADYMLKSAPSSDLATLVVRQSKARPTTPEQAEAERARMKADFLWWGEVGASGTFTAELVIAPDFAVGRAAWQQFSEPDLGAILFPQHSQLYLPTTGGTDPLVPLSLALAHLKVGSYAAASKAAYGARATLDQAGGVGKIGQFVEATSDVTSGDYEGAVKLFGEIDSGEGLTPEGLVNRAETRMLLADFNGARADTDRAIVDRDAVSKTVAKAYLVRARIRAVQGEVAQAVTDLDESTRLDPHYLPTKLDKAEALYRQGQAEAAHKELETLVQAAPDAAPAHRLMGLVRLMLAQPEEALKSLDISAGIFRKWIEQLRGEEAQAQVTGDGARAQSATDGIVRLNRELAAALLYEGMAWGDIARKEPAETFFGGVWRQLRGQPTTWERALQSMQEAGRLDPTRADVYLRMGEAYSSAGDTGKAAEAYRSALSIDPNAPEPYLGLARLQQAQGKPQEAVKTLNSLLLNSPRYYAAYEELRAIYAGAGDEQSARDSLQRGVQVSPQSPSDHLWRGKFLRALADKEGAVAEFRAASQDPQLWEAHLQLGELLQEAGQGADALAEFKQALDKQPNNPTALLRAGQLLVLAGQADEAEEMFKRLTGLSPANVEGHIAYLQLLLNKGDAKGAVDEGRRAVQADDKRADAHLFLGAALEAQKEWSGASEQYKAATERDPTLVEAFIRLGRSLFYEDRYSEAMQVSDTAIKMRPGDAQPYRWKAEAQQALGDSEGALVTLHTALQLSPQYAEAIALASRAFARQGDEQSALEYANRAIQADGRNIAGLLALGEIHLDKGRSTEAIDAYKSALAISPQSAEATTGLGRAYAQSSDRQKALQMYRDALEADQHFAEAHLYAGHSYVEMGRWDEAFTEYRSAVQLRPKWPLALYYLGRAYTQRRDLENARSAFLKATQGSPLFVEAWFGLGIADRDMGRSKEAIDALVKATQLNSSYAEAWLYLGLTLEESGDRAGATQAFAHARDTASDPNIKQQAEKGLLRVQ